MIIQNSHTNDNFESFIKSNKKTFKNNVIWYNVRNFRITDTNTVITLWSCAQILRENMSNLLLWLRRMRNSLCDLILIAYIYKDKNLSGPHNDGLITDQTRRNNYRLTCNISLDFKNIADIWAGWLSLLLSGLCKYCLDIYNNMVTDIVSTFQIFHTYLVLLLFKINLKEKNTHFF